jgi:hypothetical protein
MGSRIGGDLQAPQQMTVSSFSIDKNQRNSMNSSELDRFDQLWVHLFENIPFPLEVKYRLKFTCMLLMRMLFG